MSLKQELLVGWPSHNQVLANQKRSREVLMSNDFSKYGTTSGVLSTSHMDAFSCVFFCTGWPNWAWAAQTRGWHIVTIIIKDSSWDQMIRSCFPSTCVITYVLGLDLEQAFGKIKMWFSEIDPPRSLALWDSDAEIIITGRQARHVTDHSWKMCTLDFEHSRYDGIMDGKWILYFFTKDPHQCFLTPEDLGSGI
jgi:hypothetical protein